MDNKNTTALNNKVYLKNNEILLKIIKKLEIITKDLKNEKPLDFINKEVYDIITFINNIINENKKNLIIKSNKIFNFGKYIGEMKNEKREGKGICYYNDGGRFEGTWKNDQAENGIMYYKNDFEIYIGDIKNTLRDGKGIYYYKEGDTYEGEWKNHYFDGKGIFYFNNGDIYDGEYKNDKREGKGIYYYNNGDIYEGDWKNSKREGRGIIYYNNNDRRMGDYLNDQPVGKHVILYANGDVYSEIF